MFSLFDLEMSNALKISRDFGSTGCTRDSSKEKTILEKIKLGSKQLRAACEPGS